MSGLETPVPAPARPGYPEEITVGKSSVVAGTGKEAEIFTMTLGGETISLLPHRNWSQQDVYKWRARGKLPGTPAGLEITFDHVKVAGEAVSIKDPAGTAKLQRLLNEWLALERETLKLAQHKADLKQTPLRHEASVAPENLLPQFRVEVDKQGHVHIKCLQGKETLAMIGLNLPGLNSLISQGLMHKPHALQVGALHDWVELDGEFFSFEKGNNDASKLEKALNERYLSVAALGQGKEVVVFANAASPTGFDIQFAAKVGGVIDHHRRPLNEESLELLQAPDRCTLLPKGLVIKLSPPNLIFKCKTPDGGERYLSRLPENIVTVIGDEGEVKTIDLSQPVNYLRLTAVELTAVFNHPAINQHSSASPQVAQPSGLPQAARVSAPPAADRPRPAAAASSPSTTETRPIAAPKFQTEASPPREAPKPVVPKPDREKAVPQPAQVIRPLPNLWLEAILRRPSIRPEWFSCLVYRRIAEYFGNSREDMFGPIPCWASSLGDVESICDPSFRGLFLTQKGGLGYLNQGRIARFHHEVAFVGTLESAIEGIDVKLMAVGTDAQQRVVFIVSDGYRAQFGIPEQAVVEELARLRQSGAVVMCANEILQSPEPLEVIWTVPAEQENPDDPQAAENPRPGSAGAD